MADLRLDATAALERIEELIVAVEQAKKDLDDRLSPMLRDQARLDARLKLLKELRSTYAVHPEPASDLLVQDLTFSGRVPTTELTSTRIQSQVIEILGDHEGGPLHSNDLRAEFLRRGWPIPGAGKPNNITAHLTYAADIYSPQRGFWALGENPQAGMKSSASRRSKKRRGTK